MSQSHSKEFVSQRPRPASRHAVQLPVAAAPYGRGRRRSSPRPSCGPGEGELELLAGTPLDAVAVVQRRVDFRGRGWDGRRPPGGQALPLQSWSSRYDGNLMSRSQPRAQKPLPPALRRVVSEKTAINDECNVARLGRPMRSEKDAARTV